MGVWKTWNIVGGHVGGIGAALLLGGGLLAASSVDIAPASETAAAPTVLAAVQSRPTTSIGEAVTITRDTLSETTQPTTTQLAPATIQLAPETTLLALPAAAVADPVLLDPPNTTIAVVPTSVAVAPVVTTAPPPAAPTPEQLLSQANSALNFDFATNFPNWLLTVGPPRDGLRALTFPSRNHIEMYIRPSDTAASVARVLAHEIGHVVDIERNDGADRQAWRAARGIDSSVPWWPNEGTFDFDTGAGDFAESFAVWLVGADSKTRVASPGLTEAQRTVMAQLVSG